MINKRPDEFVTKQHSKILKKLKFDWDCAYAYPKEIKGQEYLRVYPMPTLSVCCKWFREVHSIHIKPRPIPRGSSKIIYGLGICYIKNGKYKNVSFPIIRGLNYYETYEEAQIAGIDWVFDNLITIGRTNRKLDLTEKKKQPSNIFKNLKLEFIKKNIILCNKVFSNSQGHSSKDGKKLINLALNKLGYSQSTWKGDIYIVLENLYKKLEKSKS